MMTSWKLESPPVLSTQLQQAAPVAWPKARTYRCSNLEDQLTGDRGDRRGAGNETKKKMEKIQKEQEHIQ